MADELKDQRVVVLMTPTESEAIDAWSFENRIRSKGEAIRRLCQAGLAYYGEAPRITKAAEELSSAMEKLSAADSDAQREADENWIDSHMEAVDQLVEKSFNLMMALLVIETTSQYLASKNPHAAERAKSVIEKFREVADERDLAKLEAMAKE